MFFLYNQISQANGSEASKYSFSYVDGQHLFIDLINVLEQRDLFQPDFGFFLSEYIAVNGFFVRNFSTTVVRKSF